MNVQAEPGEIPGYDGAEELAQGSSAIVYRARQAEFARDVAIKVLRSRARGEGRWRFERECRAVGALSGHPSIVTVYEAGVLDDGRPFIVMEYLPGGTLASVLEYTGPLPWAEVARVGIGLAGALQTAHDAGVLHRDVKPDNVLLSAYGEHKLVDFGIAWMRDASVTEAGSVAATVLHAAPEVLEGADPSVTTDVYSLCSLLYTLLVGHAPFERSGEVAFAPLLARIVRDDPPPIPPERAPDALAQVVIGGLSKDPAARPQSAAQLGRQLQAAQLTSGAPVVAMPLATADPLEAAAPKRTRRWALRRDRERQGTRSTRYLWLALAGALIACGALLVAVNQRADDAKASRPKAVRYVDGFGKDLGWQTKLTADVAEAGFANGRYRMSLLQGGNLYVSAPGRVSAQLGTTKVAALAWLESSEATATPGLGSTPSAWVGLVCRYDDRSGARYYYGAVDPRNGGWGIFKAPVSGDPVPLASNLDAGLETVGSFSRLELTCADQQGGVAIVMQSGSKVIGEALDLVDPIKRGAVGLLLWAPAGVTASALFDDFNVSGSRNAESGSAATSPALSTLG